MKTLKEIQDRADELLRKSDECRNKMDDTNTSRQEYMMLVSDLSDIRNEMRILKWVLE